MARAAILLLAAGSCLLLSSSARAKASVEAGEGDGVMADVFAPVPSLDVLTDRMETLFNQVTQEPADVDADAAVANANAFLQLLQQSEGTSVLREPYRACYGYTHTIADLSDHPAVTGEWRGLQLSDDTCRRAGFGPGCVSSAAGAYQIVKGTWLRAKRALDLPDFDQVSQDRAALWLIEQRGALEDVKAGRIVQAVSKCRNEWASLPGNYAGQGQHPVEQLLAWYQQAGGNLA